MRAFIAVDLSREVHSNIEAVVARWKKRLPGARWLPSKNQHLTLRFLGETEENVLSAVVQDLEPVVRRFFSFRLDFCGLGFFPNPRRARVLWVGVERPPEALFELQRATEAVVRQHRFATEARGFSPHLTIARFRDTPPERALADMAREHQTERFGVSPVTEVVVYRSILKPGGAEYHALKRLPLGGEAGG